MELNKEKILKAGEIAAEAKKYARTIIKKDVLLVDIANKIEDKIEELGGKLAFPVNLSINEIAAHYTPSYDDKSIAHGLLKIDLGVHIDGWCADTAFSLDLENNEENKKLIIAAEAAVHAGIDTIQENVGLNEVGIAIEKALTDNDFNTIVNLSGHSIDHYDLHSGVTVPNLDNGDDDPVEKRLYAIEPFATSGNGKVYDGPPSGIYQLVDEKNVRSPIAREVLDYIKKEHSTLPFCSRWIVKKFGSKALFGLKQLESNGNVHSFAQLIETSKNKVAQAEHSVLIEEDQIIVTTSED
jgi:methionyl aminopeptidase